jgi:hypothetical protein
LTLTLTDQEIPASPAFIEFLYATLKGLPYHTGEWFAQEAVGLSKAEQRFEDIQKMASRWFCVPTVISKSCLRVKLTRSKALRNFYIATKIMMNPKNSGNYSEKTKYLLILRCFLS